MAGGRKRISKGAYWAFTTRGSQKTAFRDAGINKGPGNGFETRREEVVLGTSSRWEKPGHSPFKGLGYRNSVA